MADVPTARRTKHGGMSQGQKQSHVAAEKRRREAIRQGFLQITQVVPGLDESQSRSETFVLEQTVALLKELAAENDALRSLARANNIRDTNE